MSSKACVTDLPPELLDRILSFSNSDPSIHAASLVCKAWRAGALRYLFDRADFGMMSDFQRWKKLEKALPRALEHVKEVKAKLVTPIPDIGLNLIDAKKCPIFPQATHLLWHYKCTTSRLTDLPSCSAIAHFFSRLPALENVSLFGSWPVPAVVNVLSAQSSIRSFAWEGDIDMDFSADEDGFGGDLSGLQELRVVHPSHGPELKWLLDAITRQGVALSSLEWRAQCGKALSPEYFASLLRGLSNSLMRFGCEQRDRERSGEPDGCVGDIWVDVFEALVETGFPRMTQLAVYGILLAGNADEGRTQSRLRWLSSFLARFPGGLVEDISITFSFYTTIYLHCINEVWNPDLFDWVVFRDIIAQRYPRLRRLNIITAVEDIESMYPDVRKGVPEQWKTALSGIKAAIHFTWVSIVWNQVGGEYGEVVEEMLLS